MRLSRPAFWARRNLPARLLWPLSRVFSHLAERRRRAYRGGALPVERLPVPVIVVGNISVGGSGKTPIVAWLAEQLRRAGQRPAILSRGFGGSVSAAGGCALVTEQDDPARVGDEPVLLRALCGCPVAVGAQRAQAGRALLAAHPECTVLLTDDGLQHYALARTLEVCVVDASGLGNGWQLPAGPLREPLSRLEEVDVVLAHGGWPDAWPAPQRAPVFAFHLRGETLHRLQDGQTRPLADFAGQRVHAVAGIGQPERFFASLRAAGLLVEPHPFPDHYVFRPEDLRFAPDAPIVMTAKDAVKCAAFAPAHCWVLPVEAVLEEAAAHLILEKLAYGSPSDGNSGVPAVQGAAAQTQ
ncbi:MAG: tetraacyldisaccharide 4'-kinase [Rhodocyclaceae bacterium]|nr:tetraacyldisaccharide 4'-kinase [Rhodocyclaceae bacterium]